MIVQQMIAGRGYDGHTESDVCAYVPIKPAPIFAVDAEHFVRHGYRRWSTWEPQVMWARNIGYGAHWSLAFWSVIHGVEE